MGGGTGGSSAGEIAYPAYMERVHEDWLDNTGGVTMTLSVVELMEAAHVAANPFAGFATANPANVMGSGVQALTPFQAVEDLDALDLQAIFDAFFLVIDDATARANIITAESAVLNNRLTTIVQPEFERGMRDIGAVLTTGFTIGWANIVADNNRQIAKLDAELALQSRRMGWQMSMQWVQMNIDWNKIVAGLADEVAVRYLEARYKGDQLDVEMDAKAALFDLEVYQYGSNVLASISGAAATSKPETSMVATALGGIMSGAATGAGIGSVVPVIGTTAGAAIGAALGLAAAIF